jgi:hypothetical protein
LIPVPCISARVFGERHVEVVVVGMDGRNFHGVSFYCIDDIIDALPKIFQFSKVVHLSAEIVG